MAIATMDGYLDDGQLHKPHAVQEMNPGALIGHLVRGGERDDDVSRHMGRHRWGDAGGRRRPGGARRLVGRRG